MMKTSYAISLDGTRIAYNCRGTGPADFRCPVLWLVGSEDEPAMASVREYETNLPGTTVQLQVVEGLDHGQTFEEIDRVFETMLAFTQR